MPDDIRTYSLVELNSGEQVLISSVVGATVTIDIIGDETVNTTQLDIDHTQYTELVKQAVTNDIPSGTIQALAVNTDMTDTTQTNTTEVTN